MESRASGQIKSISSNQKCIIKSKAYIVKSKAYIVKSEVYDHEAKGQQIRSKAAWLENNERPTRYFFGLEKSRQSKGVITELTTNNGSITNNQSILTEIHRFYQELYTPEQVNPRDQQALLESLDSKLNHAQRS